LEYIVKEKEQRDRRNGQLRVKSAQANRKETINEYSNLIEYIKRLVLTDDNMKIDLSSLNRNKSLTSKSIKPKKSSQISNINNELSISKKLISKTLCKDIYDWSLVHIEKAILQANINDKQLDEIIVIGNKSKMPGFYEILKEMFSRKKISFVDDDDLALGAAIVGRKSKYQQIKVTEVLCKSIGIGLYTGVITYLLFRNSSLPCVGGCVYSTLIDDQESMVLDVYEGERPHIKFCRYLGEVTVLGLPKVVLFFFRK
jgi:molecular chaperone DnaK (HSP70)